MSRRIPLLAFVVLSLSAIAQADLVALYRMDADENPQPDSSEFGNHAEVIDATWVNDPERGGVMQFEGEGDNNPVQWLEVEDSDSLSIEETGLTIATWANFDQFESWNSIVAKTGESAQNKPSPYDVYTHRGSGLPQLFVGEGNGAIQAVTADETAELGTWTHIAVTLDEEGELVHYLDGEENGIGFIDREGTPLIDEDQNLFIGSRLDGTTNMHGLLDDVAIFNQALTPTQIQNIMSGDFSEFGVGNGTPGDFDGNGELTAADIDALTVAICEGSMEAQFDLNEDGTVDQADREVWVEQLKNTFFGDSNLDGEFNSADFVLVFQRGEYEDAMAGNSTWEDGDWDGNKEFDSSDFVKAFQGGGYETGPKGGNAVPEPSSLVLLLLSGLAISLLRGRRDR